MKKTRWYCDRCGKEFYTSGLLTPIEIKSIGQTSAGDYMRKKREFCKDCFQEVKEQLLSVMLQEETESKGE